MKPIILSLYILALFLNGTNNLSYAKETCIPRNKNNLKVEAWLSKKYKNNYLAIQKEFREIGNTKVALFIYPAENPSRVVAIGRCVPVYMAQYFLHKATKYSLGTTHLVYQELISENWIGMGSPIFGKTSMRKISPQQLSMLMNGNLDTESFQKLYNSFTVQNKKINLYGLLLDNPRFLPNDQ